MCDRCKCKGLLSQKSISATKHRRAIIKVLTLAGKSLTPPELLKEIRAFLPINKVTLYRILRLLEQKEIVRKIPTPVNIYRYDIIDPQLNGVRSLPPRFICRRCKVILPLSKVDMPAEIKNTLGKKFAGPFELTIEGICANCRKEVK